MLTAAKTIGTDDWWALKLATEMGAGFPRLGRLASYYNGTVAVPDGATGSFRDSYARFVNLGRLNGGRLICSAVTSRQVPVGFRTAVVEDEEGDAAAMVQWRRSHMATQSRDLFEDVAVYGTGYAMVDGDGLVVKLSPWNTITDAPASTPWLSDAAVVATWDAINEQDVLTLFRPGYSRRAVLPGSKSTIPVDGSAWTPSTGFTWAEAPQPIPWTPNIPVVPFVAAGGLGQFEPHTDTLDRINHTIFQRLVIVAMQAFRQRALTGNLPQVYPEGTPQAGQAIDYNDLFSAGPAALWILPPGAQVWESQVTDITPILSAVDKDLKYLAAVSSTPLYVLSPDAAAGSAEGASLARETLVYKVEDLNARLGDSLAELMALTFAALGDQTRSDAASIVPLWQPADRSSISERAAAASQAVTSLPKKTIWREIYQLDPDQIAQAEQDQDDQAFAEVPSGDGSQQSVGQAGATVQ